MATAPKLQKLEDSTVSKCRCCDSDITEKTRLSKKFNLFGICNRCPTEVEIYLDNICTINCSQSCGTTDKYLNCAKCVYQKIISLGGEINYNNYQHISRLKEVLEKYKLPAKLVPANCPDNNPTISLALQKWNHINEFHSKIMKRSTYLYPDQHRSSGYQEYYLALDMQYSLALRVTSEKGVLSIGLLNMRTIHIDQFFERDNKYFLKYEYVGKLNHSSDGVRLISRELFKRVDHPGYNQR